MNGRWRSYTSAWLFCSRLIWILLIPLSNKSGRVSKHSHTR